MALKTIDELQLNYRNYIYYYFDLNPLYAALTIFLINKNIIKLKNSDFINRDDNYRKQMIIIQEIFRKNPDKFHYSLKYAIEHGFINDLSVRYVYSDKNQHLLSYDSEYIMRSRESHIFHSLKFKIINEKIYIYDMMLSLENQKMVEISEINGYPCYEILKKLLDDGYTNNQIEILLQHKEILSSYGFNSDNHKITIANSKVEYILDSEIVNIDFDIFYKEHNRSKMLDKTNFSIIRNNESKEILSYGFDSNLGLLQMLHGLLKSEKDLNLLKNIYNRNLSLIGNGTNMEENIDWMFISSFFLINQEEKGELPDYIYPDLERKIKLSSNDEPYLIFLHDNNQEESYGFNVTSNTCGCNSYMYENGIIDTKKIFHAVRNAFAHSSYEVVDKDYIRIYYKDDKTNNMTTNFKIKKDIIIEFIDKISTYRNFGNLFPICTLEHPKVNDISIKNEDELISYLKDVVISDINIREYLNVERIEIIHGCVRLHKNKEKAFFQVKEFEYTKNHKSGDILAFFEEYMREYLDYEILDFKLSNEQIESVKRKLLQFKDVFFGNSAYNQHKIITEFVIDEVNPNRNISSIIADIVGTEKKLLEILWIC